MKLQILPLPPENVGGYTTTPYILVLSECSEAQLDNLEMKEQEFVNAYKRCEGLFFTSSPVELA